MVAVLLAAARIATGCLQVSAHVRADPNVSPGRRDREALDAIQSHGLSKHAAPMVYVPKAPSDAAPLDWYALCFAAVRPLT